MTPSPSPTPYKPKNLPYILFAHRDGAGFGGFNRRIGANIPKGTKLMFALREPAGDRIIKTADRRYFVLARQP